ncbi:MAG: hypothetical protein WED04_09285 [Promethearchaeati archaeon SRVP18_Atabeyarchaeia-1]
MRQGRKYGTTGTPINGKIKAHGPATEQDDKKGYTTENRRNRAVRQRSLQPAKILGATPQPEAERDNLDLLSELEKKGSDFEGIADRALKDQDTLAEVVKGLSSDKARMKYGCAKVLRIIGELSPQTLYPKWDFFASMLSSGNTFLKSDAVFILGHLARVDSENKIEPIFDRLYELLDDESMITAANLVGASANIAKSKPQLQTRITSKLLGIDQTHHGSECKNVLKGHLISTFDQYFGSLRDKKKVLDFVRSELKNARPATRKKAEKFLEKWG